MAKFQRGFKAEAIRLASDIRHELGLSPFEALNPSVLAEYLEIPITPLSAIRHQAENADYFLVKEKNAFSALTVLRGAKRLIVHNDSHTQGRQNSNLAHELAHALLMHEATPALDDRGCRNWDQSIEDEAEWLAGVLLIPDNAAVRIARGYWGNIQESAQHFGVSKSMVQYRLNVTAAHKRAFAKVV